MDDTENLASPSSPACKKLTYRHHTQPMDCLPAYYHVEASSFSLFEEFWVKPGHVSVDERSFKFKPPLGAPEAAAGSWWTRLRSA